MSASGHKYLQRRGELSENALVEELRRGVRGQRSS
jgi:hypothetical protein